MKTTEFDEWFLLFNKAIEYGLSKEEVKRFFQEHSKIKDTKEKIQAK